ncbi:hypothetical protein BDR04DRAFT_613911 [Suillus decipiens]|nr:hypothetical protein BDR04DRAFT_613911 [Suillus decipiens]
MSCLPNFLILTRPGVALIRRTLYCMLQISLWIGVCVRRPHYELTFMLRDVGQMNCSIGECYNSNGSDILVYDNHERSSA